MRGAPVTLTWQEFAAATHTGLLRFTQSETAGMNHASTYRRSDWTERLRDEVTGACGEIAVAKLLGWYWSPSVNTFHHVADVGSEYKVEVRATLRTDGCLIVRDNDATERYYAFVVGPPPNVVVVGWITGRDAMCEKWVRDPGGHRPAWFVPQKALNSFRPREGRK